MPIASAVARLAIVRVWRAPPFCARVRARPWVRLVEMVAARMVRRTVDWLSADHRRHAALAQVGLPEVGLAQVVLEVGLAQVGHAASSQSAQSVDVGQGGGLLLLQRGHLLLLQRPEPLVAGAAGQRVEPPGSHRVQPKRKIQHTVHRAKVAHRSRPPAAAVRARPPATHLVEPARPEIGPAAEAVEASVPAATPSLLGSCGRGGGTRGS